MASLATAFALCAGAAVMLRAKPSSAEAPRTWDVAAERVRRDADIAFYMKRVSEDPTGALDELRLAALYLQRARERGAPADLLQAETSARRSLVNRRAHNAEAYRALALALIGQHRFIEARAAADSLVADDPSSVSARSLLGEILLELGEYPAADTIFTALDQSGVDPAVGSRIARWAALRGRSAHARALLTNARATVHEQFGVPAEQVAWFDLRLGELALTVGQHDDAAQHFAAALAIVPDDPRTHLALARLDLARDDAAGALEHSTTAMNLGEDPMAFAITSEAYRRQGDSLESDRYLAAFETAIAAAPPSAWHRDWQIALLDRGRQVDAVLAQAEADLKVRRDVFGWDLYAWALHHAGRNADASTAMAKALASGTEDVRLQAHARAIGMTGP
ncbi:MAG: tetratricopeptide repeat protein [Gemmatimonadales bacterium]|nr:tetratricopeptide repeat protein [Gemmatimonadales bacterium]